ncbi:uncharacterized protein LOC135214063 [Macrobrachium nipponense]|uniref:uncharacterized protein LOC135214063 n=1 Tax=Macrobrachium nipponense TaxID=159736 RepID=UPI0030C8546D
MAQVPTEGPEDLLVMSEEVLPSWSFSGILGDNLYAGLLGGLCGLLFILFLNHQDGKLACETAINANLTIHCEVDLQDTHFSLEKEVDEAQDLLEDKAQMTMKEDALQQRIQDLVKPLANEEDSHAEEILDLSQEAERKIQEAEEIGYLNCLLTTNKIPQERLNECEAEKGKTGEEMDKQTLKLECDLECHLNERRNLMKMESADEEQGKDGKQFLRIVDEEVTKLEHLINSTELDLETFRPQMSEEVQGKVLAATGKARLLIAQKIEQFRGLCQQNIDGPKGGEPTIMAADLEGFWDMVSIQVENVHHLFKEVSVLKTNGWKEDLITEPTNNVTKGPQKKKPVKVMKKALKSSSEEQKSRDEARKKLLEERRKALKEAMKAKQGQPDANGSTDGVEILVAKEKITYLQENLTGEKKDERTKSDEGGPVNEKTKEVEKQKEGHHFLQLVDKEVSELQGLTYNAESDLETFKPEMSEEVQGKGPRQATGKGGGLP